MKFAFLPTPWDQVVTDLEDAGHSHVGLEDDPDLLVFRGQPEQFPETLPDSVKVVQICSAGIEHLSEAGVFDGRGEVRFANAAGIYDDTVAEAALALILAVMHRHKAVSREWNQRQLFKRTQYLCDQATVAVIGAGGIGKKLIKLVAPFGAETIAVNRSGHAVEGATKTVAMSDAAAMEKVWAEADCFVLIAPLTDDTRHVVNAEVLAAMKESAIVINVGRGGLVDTPALTDALARGVIAGAGLDVTEPEPLPAGHPLWEADNCVITPHTANIPRFMKRRVGPLTVANWERFEAGEKMITEVDLKAGY